MPLNRKDEFLPGDEWVFAEAERRLDRAITEAFAQEPRLVQAGLGHQAAFRALFAEEGQLDSFADPACLRSYLDAVC